MYGKEKLRLMNKQEMIMDYAFSIGFHQIGFGKVRRFDELEKIYADREFLEFEDIDVEKHVNPMIHFSGGKTFIALGLSYDLDKSISLKKTEVKVSSSSKPDYHRIIREKLNEMLLFIENLLECNGKTFVDIEGLNDRYVAYLSGFGFYGKNGHIISPYLGTNYNIGYLIIDKELNMNNIAIGDCKDCDLCVKACPTGAIKGDYTIEAQKCLSYITQKKKLSDYEETLIKDCIYGCDICQKVCPHNHVLGDGLESVVDGTKLLDLSNRLFKREYGDYDFSWRGYSIIKRNVILNFKNRESDI